MPHDPDVLDARRLGDPGDQPPGARARPWPTSWATTSACPTSTPAPPPAVGQGPRPGRHAPSAGQTWSLMSWEEQFAQPVVVEKMMLGWVDAAHVRNLSFATLGPVDEEIVLHASDLGAPPAGRHSAVEIRIADGRELLLRVPAGAADGAQGPGRAGRPHRRRHRLRVRRRAGRPAQHPAHPRRQRRSTRRVPAQRRLRGAGHLRGAPTRTTSRWTVARDGGGLRPDPHHYGDAKPDPQIRPWAPSTNWKSPDLRVTNARNLADTALPRHPVGGTRQPHRRHRPQPREGRRHRGPGRTSSSRTSPSAAGPRPRWAATPTTWSPATWSSSPRRCPGCRRRCRPSRSSTSARTTAWSPGSPSTQDPGNPAIREITLDNNEAQSNHTQLISVSASPSTREMGSSRSPTRCRSRPTAG